MSFPPLPCQATAIYSWSGEQDSDLGMIEGDRIEVMDYGDGNWWYGKLQRNKMQGLFPKNFVKILEIQQSPSRQSLHSIQKGFPQSPSFNTNPGHPYKKKLLHPSFSQQNLSHPSSQQIFSDHETREDVEDNDLKKFSYQSSKNYPYKQQPKYYSTTDLAKFSQVSAKSSPIRDEVVYSSGSEEEGFDNIDNDLDSDDELPPPPPPKTRQSKENLTKFSKFSNPSSTNVKSSQMYNYQSSSIESPPPKIGEFSMLKNSMQRGGLDISAYSLKSQQFFDSMISTDTERSILFGHSNFSATSAGSLARHKYQSDMNDRESKLREVQRQGGLQSFNEQEQVEILKKVFVDKKQSRHPKLLKKLFAKDNDNLIASLDDQIHGLSLNQRPSIETQVSSSSFRSFEDEVDPRIEILKQPTLTPLQKSKREERVTEDNPYFILKPFDGINPVLNHNEIVSKPTVNIDSIPLYHVDKFVRVMPVDKFESIESVALNSIASKFQSDLEKLRAIYCFCTERIELIPVEYEPMDRRSSPKMTDVMFQKRATPYQLTWLFTLMANCLHIKTELILGHFKTPFNDINETSTADKLAPNHSWLSISIEGQWRIIDVVLGNLTNELFTSLNANASNYEIQQSFYFLTKPLDVIYTHVPLIIEQQHITPPIDPVILLSLPPLYPAYFHYGIKYYRFNNALAYMKNFEISEFQIQVPPDVEIVAKIQCDVEDGNGIITELDIQALAQPLWHKNKKIFIVRGVLPPRHSMGFMKIYVGDKNISNSNDYMLCSTIQLCHQGTYKLLSFVKRYPTVHSLKQDLYVTSPQFYDLSLNQNVEFIIKQHPSFEIDSYNKLNLKTKLALQSPGGNIIKFTLPLDGKIYGDWILNMRLNEKGLWRGLVLTDDGLRWSIFCEWNCV